MKGTENQIKFANDLLNETRKRVELFDSKGKGERVANEKLFLSLITDETEAGTVIYICKNFNSIVDGISRGKMTFETEITKSY